MKKICILVFLFFSIIFNSFTQENEEFISVSDEDILEEDKKIPQKTTRNFFIYIFTNDFSYREPRWLIGYNYFPDFSLSVEFGFLKNGTGFYTGVGAEPRNLDNNYNFNNIGETIGVLNWSLGITYPLLSDKMWIAGGAEMCVVNISTEQADYNWTQYLSEQKIGVNYSIGLYIFIKHIYITSKYRYLFYNTKPHSFMLGIGIGI